jgi:predicted XRE-type DNA-binding protein
MDPKKRRRLEKAGYHVTTTQEFLGLSDEEAAYVELKVILARALRRLREDRRITQEQLASWIGTVQPNVSRMEHSDSVSIDNLCFALLTLGATRREIGRTISEKTAA